MTGGLEEKGVVTLVKYNRKYRHTNRNEFCKGQIGLCSIGSKNSIDDPKKVPIKQKFNV